MAQAPAFAGTMRLLSAPPPPPERAAAPEPAFGGAGMRLVRALPGAPALPGLVLGSCLGPDAVCWPARENGDADGEADVVLEGVLALSLDFLARLL
jgi:hypothetical protein